MTAFRIETVDSVFDLAVTLISEPVISIVSRICVVMRLRNQKIPAIRELNLAILFDGSATLSVFLMYGIHAYVLHPL